MSWSFSIPPTEPADFLAALGSAQPTGTSSDERDEQVVAAKAAVMFLFDSPALGNVGQSGSKIGCIASGHAQPGHALTGQPEDFQSENVVINLYRIVDAVPAAIQSVAEEPVVVAAAESAPEASAPSPETEPEPVASEESNDPDAGGDEEPTTQPAASVVTGGLSQ